jgi:hypothetical protein
MTRAARMRSSPPSSSVCSAADTRSVGSDTGRQARRRGHALPRRCHRDEGARLRAGGTRRRSSRSMFVTVSVSMTNVSQVGAMSTREHRPNELHRLVRGAVSATESASASLRFDRRLEPDELVSQAVAGSAVGRSVAANRLASKCGLTRSRCACERAHHPGHGPGCGRRWLPGWFEVAVAVGIAVGTRGPSRRGSRPGMFGLIVGCSGGEGEASGCAVVAPGEHVSG